MYFQFPIQVNRGTEREKYIMWWMSAQ